MHHVCTDHSWLWARMSTEWLRCQVNQRCFVWRIAPGHLGHFRLGNRFSGVGAWRLLFICSHSSFSQTRLTKRRRHYKLFLSWWKSCATHMDCINHEVAMVRTGLRRYIQFNVCNRFHLLPPFRCIQHLRNGSLIWAHVDWRHENQCIRVSPMLTVAMVGLNMHRLTGCFTQLFWPTTHSAHLFHCTGD